MRKLVLLALLVQGTVLAAPPVEVPPDAVFGADAQTLTWSAPSGGADTYDVYRGTSPSVYDQQCRVTGILQLQATFAEIPDPGTSFFYLVGAVNIDGAGPIGTDSGGAPIPNLAPCVDLDGDSFADNLDNCPGMANPTQDDQDANGVGDRCDPNTYDFETGTIGMRPMEMTQTGSPAPLAVTDIGGDLGVSYAATTDDVTDRFDRLLAGMTWQDVTVYLDFEDTAATTALELWSDGAFSLEAGTGVVLEIDPNRALKLHSRLNDNGTSTAGPVVPVNGRLRLRLVKAAGNTSNLHVDTWDGTVFVPDYVVFHIADDHRHRGLATALSSRGSGERGVKRVTVVHEIPPGPLTLRTDPTWSMDWKLFQRDSADRAPIPLKFYYRLEEPGRAQARVVHAGTTSVLPGHDYTDHEAPLPISTGAGAELVVMDVPAGGNYDVHLRLVRDSDGAELAQATLAEVAVGDVFIAAGQSNMAGRGGFAAGEAKIDEVHFFHNNGQWRKAEEPMDSTVDQVDNVSRDSQLGHSLMLRFAKDVRAAIGIPTAVIPGPLEGSDIWSEWARDEADHDNRGTLYGSLLHRLQLQGYTEPPRGFLWYQGESDVGRTTVDYKADLQTLIANIREDYGDPNMPVLIAQLATYSNQTFEDLLRIQEAQRQVVLDDPNTALITTIDQQRADNVHLVQLGLREVGARFAEAARKLIYGESLTPLLELVDARRTIGATEIELEYDGSVTGGDQALYSVTDTAGNPNVTQIAVAGSIVTLSLDRSLVGAATVSYGYSSAWTDPWVEDPQGVPVAMFFEIPVP